jgi:hypothetical protein
VRRAVAVFVLAACAIAHADPDFELGRSDKGRHAIEGTTSVLIAVDAKADAARWDTSIHDAAVAEARQERGEELGDGLVVAGIVATALGASVISRHPAAGLATAAGGWITIDVGSLVYAFAQPDSGGGGRRHHRH